MLLKKLADNQYIDMFCNIHVQPTWTPFYNLNDSVLHIASTGHFNISLILLKGAEV